MTARVCAKEVICCTRARAAIESLEENIKAGNFRGRLGRETRSQLAICVDKFNEEFDAIAKPYINVDLGDNDEDAAAGD